MDRSSIHIVSQLDRNIAVLGSLGSWFEVDQMGIDILSQSVEMPGDDIITLLSPKYKAEDIRNFVETLNKALNQGSPGIFRPENQHNIINKMYLQVTTQCNLRCRYCYAEETAPSAVCKLMPLDTARKAVDLLLEENKDEKECYLDFDGGEPLLNRPLIQEVVAYIENHTKHGGPQVRMTIATNGTTLDAANAAFLNENIIRFGVSLDGTPEVHNAARPKSGGQGSYNGIMANLCSILKERHVIAQATATPQSLDVDRTAFHLAELGFWPVQVEPAYDCADKAWQIRAEDIPALTEGFTRMAETFLAELWQEKILPFYNFTEIMSRLHRRQKRRYGCSVGTRMCAVSPDGIIYPCYRFWGNREYQMGTVAKGFDRSVQEYFAGTHVDNRDGCKQCWARYFCGGKCLYISLNINGNVNKPYELNCRVFKHLLSLSLALYQHLNDKPQLKEQIAQMGGK